MRSTVVSYQVDFSKRAGGGQDRGSASTGRTPRVAVLLALAHRIDRMIRDGGLRDLADAARAIGLTRARMTQIMNLLLLAPEIQEEILDLPPMTEGRDPISERKLRRISATPCWHEQRDLWASSTAWQRL